MTTAARLTPNEIAPWLFKRDTFETKLEGETFTFTRHLPAPYVEYKTDSVYFTDKTCECFVTAIRQMPYCRVVVRSEGGTYLDTFYCQSLRIGHFVKLASWQAFGYGLHTSVEQVREPWHQGSLVASA